ncbi:MAG: polyprenol monophosphomannose synthase [Victivallales bacterium]|nr:polyprenol monophosphomannose synthase [Victivallales bacterium]
MAGKIKNSIVIPTFNEKDNIGKLIEKLKKVFPEGDTEIIVVDENSPDGTADVVNSFSEKDKTVRCILNDGIPGLSPSIVKGFDSAEGEFLGCMDGDMQHDEKCIPDFFKLAEKEYDMVIGSRYVKGGGFAQKWNPVRKLISDMSAFVARIVLGINLKDPTSGCFVVRKKAYNDVRNVMNPTGFKIMLEIYFRLKNTCKDYKMTEAPLIFRNREAGESKLSSKVIFQCAKMLFDLRKQKKY